MIAWDELTSDACAERPATVVAESWNYRSKQEHLAVGAFSMLARELSDAGCEPIVLSLVTRAANDEVRHTEICARMGFALRGAPFMPARFRGTPVTPAADVLLHVIEHCCLSETFTTVAFTEMLARTTHPTAHAVVQSLLADEVDHGRVGWAYLAERAKPGRLDGVVAALPDIFVRAVAPGMKPAEINPSEDDPAHERWGYLAPRTIASIYRRTLHDVIVPGFAEFGIDASAAMRVLAAKSWA